MSGNTSHGATPSGMSYRYYTRLLINKHNGHTIGRIHTDNHTLQLGNQRVHALKRRFLLVDIHRAIVLIDNRHAARVGLPRHDQIVEFHAQLHRQSDTGIQHPQSIIADIVTQVNTRIGIALIHLATSHRKRFHTLDSLHKI